MDRKSKEKTGKQGLGGLLRRITGARESFDSAMDPYEILKYPECGMSDSKVNALNSLFYRLERCIEERKLYLDPYISLTQVAKTVGSNRTYVSNILAPFGGYRSFMNEFRLKHIAIRIQKADNENGPFILSEQEEILSPEKISGIILTSGFADIRTFRRALDASKGKWAKRIRERIY